MRWISGIDPGRKSYKHNMAPWRNLNFLGKAFALACILNIICAVVSAKEGSYWAIFSTVMAAYCGLMTYNKRYQYQDARDINDGRKE